MKPILKKNKPQSFLFLGFLILIVWEMFVVTYQIPSYLFPKPSEILKAFWLDRALLYSHAITTLTEWSLGTVISVILGVGLSTTAMRFAYVSFFLDPLLTITQSVPYLVFTPLLLMWFGFGMAPKVILVVLTCTFPITVVMKHDMQEAMLNYALVVPMLRLNFWKALWHVYYPYALPGFFNAFSISMSYAFGATVVAELMGSADGLGIYLLRAQTTYRLDRVFVVAGLIIGLSLGVTGLARWCSRKWIFWQRG